MPNKKIHMKPQELLEIKLTQPKESFPLRPSFNFGADFKWMIGLTNLEVYISVFIKAEKFDNFEFYSDLFDGFLFYRTKRWAWGDPWFFRYFSKLLQLELLGQRIFDAFEKLESKRDGLLV